MIPFYWSHRSYHCWGYKIEGGYVITGVSCDDPVDYVDIETLLTSLHQLEHSSTPEHPNVATQESTSC